MVYWVGVGEGMEGCRGLRHRVGDWLKVVGAEFSDDGIADGGGATPVT